MKVASLVLACAVLALVALPLVPSLAGYQPPLTLAALVAAAVLVITIAIGWRSTAQPERPLAAMPAASEVPQTAREPADAGRAAIPLASQTLAQAEVVSFLATLQEKGRFVDFVEDDITGYSDAQVGAAARVVHEGCKAVLREHFRIVPVRPEHEGARVTVAPGFAADEYRLVGKINGQAPFSGTLMHRGWKTDAVTLPRPLLVGDTRLPTIAPAEVELQ